MVPSLVRSFATHPAAQYVEVSPSERESKAEQVLNSFSAANPFSAASLASRGWTPRRLADLPPEQANILLEEIPCLTRKSARLLISQAKSVYEEFQQQSEPFRFFS